MVYAYRYRRHGNARTIFRAAAVVRAIAVHNINVKNKLACVLYYRQIFRNRNLGRPARMIRFGGTDRGETSVGNKIIVENFAVKSGFVLFFFFILLFRPLSRGR